VGDWWSARTRGQKVGLVVATVVVIGIIGSSGDDGSESPSPTAAAEAAATTESTTTTAGGGMTTPTTAVTTTTRQTTTTTRATTTTTTVPDGSFGDGILLVGEDVQPGVYLNERNGCYWARLSEPSGSFDAIIANGNVSDRTIVEIIAGDEAFESSRCGLWVPYQPPVAPSDIFGDGIWAVGSDISPGLYESAQVSSCYFARLSGFSGSFSELISNNNIDSHAVVEVLASDTGFESNRCGTWTPVDTTVTVGQPQTFGDGVFLVGVHIAPGRYRVENAAGCYYARLSGVSGRFGDILVNNNVDGIATVDISPNDIAFESSRCGNWTPAG
jgi:hypothetical protein